MTYADILDSHRLEALETEADAPFTERKAVCTSAGRRGQQAGTPLGSLPLLTCQKREIMKAPSRKRTGNEVQTSAGGGKYLTQQ